MSEHLKSLIRRVETASGADNALDVDVEIALFDPDVSIRANSAGTKVIYTKRSGEEVTHWAGDHTLSPISRERTIARLQRILKGTDHE